MIIISSIIIQAQNEVDVLRFSDTDIFGSARFESMAGSFGALGADFSSIQVNPAGLARFSRSDFTVSLNNTWSNITGVYNETEAFETFRSSKLGNIGMVITRDISNENNGWLFRQFYFGYTRIKNFDANYRYEGQNFNSLLDVFANDGFGIPMDNDQIFFDRPFSTGLGLDVNAISYDPQTVSYFPNLTSGDMYHERIIQTRGGIGDFHFGWSQNFMNQLYVGASGAARRVKYTENIIHNEVLLEPDPSITSLQSFDYFYDQESAGWGFHLKLGVLYLPKEELRFGLAVETANQITITEDYSANMIAYHDYGTVPVPEQFIPFGEYKYRVRTPGKIRGSLAYIFDMKGALNIDIEYVNFGRGRLSSDPSGEFGFYSFQAENQEVANQYRAVLNTRIGAELMVAQDIFLRAGYALIPQAFRKDVVTERIPRQTLATGIGYNGKKINLDLSYRALNIPSEYYAFDPSQAQNRTSFSNWMQTVVVTFSTRF